MSEPKYASSYGVRIHVLLSRDLADQATPIWRQLRDAFPYNARRDEPSLSVQIVHTVEREAKAAFLHVRPIFEEDDVYANVRHAWQKAMPIVQEAVGEGTSVYFYDDERDHGWAPRG